MTPGRRGYGLFPEAVQRTNMAAQRWEDLLKSSKKTALVHDGER